MRSSPSLALALVVIVAGAAQAEPHRPDPRRPPVELTWSMKVEGAQLVVEYALVNHSSATVWAADQLLFNLGNNVFSPQPNALVTMNGSRPGLVRLVRGAVSGDGPAAWTWQPTYVRVAPRATLHGTARLGWPLHAWHNVAPVDPLRDPRTATLEIEYFVGDPPEWRTFATKDGGSLRLPEGMSPLFATADEKPLPR